MRKIELVYFGGCPNIEAAKSAIRSAGVLHFSEINLDDLAFDHRYQQYSSPTILIDGRVIVGSQNAKSACSFADWPAVALKLRRHLLQD